MSDNGLRNLCQNKMYKTWI